MDDRITMTSRFGRVLAVATGVILAGGLIAIVVDSGWVDLVRYCWPLVFIGFAVWALFWQPRLMITGGGVTLYNVLRTVYVPWGAIASVETKYALTLVTENSSYSAWAAPAPTRYGARSITKADLERLPASNLSSEKVRPGDIPTTESGQAAQAVRSRLESLRASGALDANLTEQRVVLRWHWVTIAAFVVLGIAAVASLTL